MYTKLLFQPKHFSVIEAFLGFIHVIVRLDDILVNGKNDVKHQRNFEEVPKQPSNADMRLKSVFSWYQMWSKVKAESITRGKANARAICEIPKPQNISQLNYLDMINNYHKFLL